MHSSPSTSSSMDYFKTAAAVLRFFANIIEGINDPPQCEAIKRDGDQCTRLAKPDSEYCGQHQGWSPD
jgi:hypothetical protein